MQYPNLPIGRRENNNIYDNDLISSDSNDEDDSPNDEDDSPSGNGDQAMVMRGYHHHEN